MKPFDITKTDAGADGKGFRLEVLALKNLRTVRVNNCCPLHIRATGTESSEPNTCLNCRWRTFENEQQQHFIELNKKTNQFNSMYCFYKTLDPRTLRIVP